jgi:hypothetical protein
MKELERIQKVRNATHFAFRTTNWHIAQEEMDYYDQHYGPRTFQPEPADTQTFASDPAGETPRSSANLGNGDPTDPNALHQTPIDLSDTSDPSDVSDMSHSDATQQTPTLPNTQSSIVNRQSQSKPLLIQFVDDEEENNETNPLNLFSPSKEGPGGNIYPG